MAIISLITIFKKVIIYKHNKINNKININNNININQIMQDKMVFIILLHQKGIMVLKLTFKGK